MSPPPGGGYAVKAHSPRNHAGQLNAVWHVVGVKSTHAHAHAHAHRQAGKLGVSRREATSRPARDLFVWRFEAKGGR